MADNTSVKVALRIRPLSTMERQRGYQNILEAYPDISQIKIKNRDQGFTYSHMFDEDLPQESVYVKSVQNLIDKLFCGYNVTILAYGQTGSGKTYTMGTCFCESDSPDEVGVIPRAVQDIFTKIADSTDLTTRVSVSFMELYQETLYDLLSTKPRDQSVIDIREDKQIILPGLTEVTVDSAEAVLSCLSRGSKSRATGSTAMNATSSRSHAVFTINLIIKENGNTSCVKTAKFHLVDLAGSERSKKTQATGVTFKEGININQGLLALGNVISALGDEQQQRGFINYRNSNLTRLLKDSLGGNSITLMIACVSPADNNLEETISTLRYADRALKIKNKPVVNQDAKDAQINNLNRIIQELRVQLANQGGPNVCPAELELKLHEINVHKKNVRELTMHLSNLLNENTTLVERNLLTQANNERTKKNLLAFENECKAKFIEIETKINQKQFEDIGIDFMRFSYFISSRTEEMLKEIKTNDEEVLQHDIKSSTSNASTSDIQIESEFTVEQETHTKQQMQLNIQLQDLSKALVLKEELANRLLLNNVQLDDTGAQAETQSKVLALQKEKDQLLQQLKHAKGASVGVPNKLAEQQRKKVQELEHQIDELHKKLLKQAKLIKVKETNEAHIKQLNTEIQSMKHTKVQLIRNMRTESERFRSWKIERERELTKLKEQDRKRQNQITKMEGIHLRQQNVMKRKVEEAAAINKRLKEALALRKNVQEQRGNNVKTAHWVASELEVHVRTIDAKQTLTTLMEDRANIQEQLDRLRETPETVDSGEHKQLTEEYETRSAQIQDLQQKILDSDADKVKTRLDNIQTMIEAKSAVKTLFQLVGNYRCNELKAENQVHELEAVKVQHEAEIDSLKEELRKEISKHRNDCSTIQTNYEQKIALILNAEDKSFIRPSFTIDTDMEKQKILIAEKDHELSVYKIKCKELQHKIDSVYDAATKLEPEVPKAKKKVPIIKVENVTYHDEYLSAEEDMDEENEKNDPDWRKTPLGKKYQNLKTSDIYDVTKRRSIKRSSNGGCACRSNCSSKICGCKKVNQMCGPSCKCKEAACHNRSQEERDHKSFSKAIKEVNQSDESLESDDSFKQPRPLQESNEMVKPKRTKQLFFPSDD